MLLTEVYKNTRRKGNVYQRIGYAVVIDGAPIKKYRYRNYTSSSTEYEQMPARNPAWPRWAGWAGWGKERVLKSV